MVYIENTLLLDSRSVHRSSLKISVKKEEETIPPSHEFDANTEQSCALLEKNDDSDLVLQQQQIPVDCIICSESVLYGQF